MSEASLLAEGIKMQRLKGKNILITGASSGIGKACAEQFAANGANIIISARRFDRIKDLAYKLKKKYSINVLPIELDVTQSSKVNEIIQTLPDEWKTIDVLLNNAGVGVTTDLMQDADPADWDIIIDTNVRGLLYVTRAVLPSMILRNVGHIINVGSIAGNEYWKGGSVYIASKHAVKALTRSLRLDLNGYKIRVTEVDPGFVRTEFNEVIWDKERSDELYKGFDPLIAEDIADAVIYCATRDPRVNISEMTIYPVDQASATVIHRKGDVIV